ncbi:MAG: hypothetical protein KDD48_05010 [Bdellovibrionales bacterium]|nr:hypothetical protein [Bdellovibrionales bacterium]
MSDPRIDILSFDSQLLKKNLLGDPSQRMLPVYVPPGYDDQGSLTYPVVFLLSGWGSSGPSYLQESNVFSKSLPLLFDEMILGKRVKPFLAVFPDLSTKYGGSQYVNSSVNGPYMDVLCDELVPFIDHQFRTKRSSEYRGLMGHSSGGFGALATCMLRPGIFDYCLSSSGDSFYTYLYVQLIPLMVETLSKHKSVEEFVERYLSSPNPMGLLKYADTMTMMTLCVCTCFLPNPKKSTFMADLFFDLGTGELVPQLWQQFLAWDPVHMVDRYALEMKKLKWLCLESGLQDEYALHLGHRQLSNKLKAHDIKYDLKEYPGKHGGHRYRFADRIQRMIVEMSV